jgi:hypothetical protein
MMIYLAQRNSVAEAVIFFVFVSPARTVGRLTFYEESQCHV